MRHAAQDAIEQALERRAERHARRISIDVRDGKVELSGPVQSCAEREAIIGARFTRGVTGVRDVCKVALLA